MAFEHEDDDSNDIHNPVSRRAAASLLSVGTQTIIYRCPIPGHPQDCISNTVIEHMRKNKCDGGMIIENTLTTVVCVDCDMRVSSQDAMGAHLNSCQLTLARKASDIDAILASPPKSQPSQLFSIDSEEDAADYISDAHNADPPTRSNPDVNFSGELTRNSSCMFTASRASLVLVLTPVRLSASVSTPPQTPALDLGSFGITPKKPRPLQQLTTINFNPLAILKAAGGSEESSSGVDGASILLCLFGPRFTH